jgi:hypothetical protein
MKIQSLAVAAFLLTGVAGAASASSESLQYVLSLRNPDGGYRANAAAGPSSLGATSSSLRAIKYFGGTVPDRQAVLEYLMSCVDMSAGGAADQPGGTVDVRSTAMAVMTAVELGLDSSQYEEPILRFFGERAQALPDIYIAAAALDAAGLRAPRASAWVAEYAKSGRPDGSYGDSIGDTAGAVVTILRLGGELERKEQSLALLTSAQRPDGGYGTAEASDLGTTYRVLRALRMAKAKPDTARMRAFVQSCRNSDGGYGPAPGQPSAVSPTYFAAIVLRWIDEMDRP